MSQSKISYFRNQLLPVVIRIIVVLKRFVKNTFKLYLFPRVLFSKDTLSFVEGNKFTSKAVFPNLRAKVPIILLYNSVYGGSIYVHQKELPEKCDITTDRNRFAEAAAVLYYLGVVYFFYGFSYVIYLTFFKEYLTREMGLSPIEAGNLFALVGGLSIFCGMIWGKISDLLGRSRGAALAYLVLGISYIIYALIKVKFGFYLSAVFFGLTAWSIPTIMAAAAGDFVGPRLAPAGLGFITLFFGIGQALGPAFGGYLADVSGSFTLPLVVAGCISLTGMVLSFYLKKPTTE